MTLNYLLWFPLGSEKFWKVGESKGHERTRTLYFSFTF